MSVKTSSEPRVPIEGTKKPHPEGGGFSKSRKENPLPFLGARVVEVGLETKLGWELGESVAWVHFDTVISTAASVGWLKGSVEGRAVEGHELVKSVADAFQSAATSVDNTV